MSIKVNFASVSSSAAVDQQTGSLSVFDVIEELRAPEVPFQLQTLVLTVSLEKTMPDEFNGKMMIHLILPNGTQQKVGAGDLRVPAEQKRMKAVFRYGGFPVEAFGKYRFVLSILDNSNKKIGEALMDFEAVQSAAQPQRDTGKH